MGSASKAEGLVVLPGKEEEGEGDSSEAKGSFVAATGSVCEAERNAIVRFLVALEVFGARGAGRLDASQKPVLRRTTGFCEKRFLNRTQGSLVAESR